MTEVGMTGVRKVFGGRGEVRAIDGVDLEIADGELLVLLGPSGCGKTTLLRCLAGLDEPDDGRITVGGSPVFEAAEGVAVPSHRRDIGMVFQNYALWPHLTVAENVAYPLRCRGVGRTERDAGVAGALDLVECGELADRLPAALSGGQQQRIALARALVAEPRLMLFDEPLSNLDYRLRAQLREQIRNLHRALGFTAVYVTHDQTEALQLGTRVAVLREGRIEQVGDPRSVFGSPASPYVAEFLGITNSLEVSRVDGAWCSGGNTLDLGRVGAAGTGDMTLYARPSSLHLVAAGSDGPRGGVRLRGAVVDDVLYDGDDSVWVLSWARTRLRATAATGRWPQDVGDVVDVVVPADDVLLYPAPQSTRAA